VKRIIVVIVLAAGLAAVAASPAVAVPHSCGTISVKGKTWTVTAVGLSCAAAKGVVRTLAAKPLPPRVHYAGRYLGMGCLGGKKGGRTGIECGGTGARLIVAFTG
jgi:hypothetical protein